MRPRPSRRDPAYPPPLKPSQRRRQKEQNPLWDVSAVVARLRSHLQWSHNNPDKVRIEISTPHQFKGREADTVQLDYSMMSEVVGDLCAQK